MIHCNTRHVYVIFSWKTWLYQISSFLELTTDAASYVKRNSASYNSHLSVFTGYISEHLFWQYHFSFLCARFTASNKSNKFYCACPLRWAYEFMQRFFNIQCIVNTTAWRMAGRSVRAHCWRNCYLQFENHGPHNEYADTPYVTNNVKIFKTIKAKTYIWAV